ncbi:MAG: 3-hydroxyisobutyrate dehydrogenase [Pseudomonadota bacterium]
MNTVAIIGTGNMGAPMALNLANAGINVRAYDIDEAKLDPLTPHGVIAASDHQDALDTANMCITMLPTHVEVLDVFEHFIQPSGGNMIWIDSSTIDLNVAVELHDSASAVGIKMLDAPVSGGTNGARTGTLSFMVGGSEDVLSASMTVLKAMGSKIVHCGDGGMGQAAKMCNNLMLGIQMVSVAEGFRLAQQVGLRESVLFDVASASSGNCFALQTFCPVEGLVPHAPSTRGFQPGFSAALMHKDMNLALNAATAAGLELPLAPEAASLYAKMIANGDDEKDFSAVIELMPQTGNT